MTIGNYQFGRKLRSLFRYVLFVLMLFRWSTFWILDTARGQFYNDHEGKRIRQQSLSYSRKYITENAPGESQYCELSV
jgi:hypothetical protein